MKYISLNKVPNLHIELKFLIWLHLPKDLAWKLLLQIPVFPHYALAVLTGFIYTVQFLCQEPRAEPSQGKVRIYGGKYDFFFFCLGLRLLSLLLLGHKLNQNVELFGCSTGDLILNQQKSQNQNKFHKAL